MTWFIFLLTCLLATQIIQDSSCSLSQYSIFIYLLSRWKQLSAFFFLYEYSFKRWDGLKLESCSKNPFMQKYWNGGAWPPSHVTRLIDSVDTYRRSATQHHSLVQPARDHLHLSNTILHFFLLSAYNFIFMNTDEWI